MPDTQNQHNTRRWGTEEGGCPDLAMSSERPIPGVPSDFEVTNCARVPLCVCSIAMAR